MIVRFCPSTRTTSSSPIFFSEMSPLSRERQVEPQLARRRRRATSSWASVVVQQRAPASPSPNSAVAEPVEHRRRRPTSCSKYGARSTGTGAKPDSHAARAARAGPRARRRSSRPRPPRGTRGSRPPRRSGSRTGQVGERPHRLGDHHPVGRHHEPDRDRLAVAQDLVHRDQVLAPAAGPRRTRARRAARRRRTSAPAAARRPAARRSRPNTLSSHQLRDVGEREQPQRLAGRRAVDDRSTSHSPSSTWRLSCSRLNSSSPPGGTVSSSAAIRSTPWSTNSPPSQPCTADQLRSSSSWACTCCAHRPLADLRSARRRRGASSDSASECAGSVDSTIVRCPAAAQRRAVAAATEVLPTPPLPV